MKKFYAFFILILIAGFQLLTAQGLVVNGKVTSSDDHQAVPGVSVLVKGTTIGTITDVDGNYSLQVPKDAKDLIFAFVGMKTQEIPINGRTAIDVILEPDVIGIEEVIVTAMGMTRQTKALGYAAESVQGENLVKSGETNIIQSLASKAAGVQITGTSGTPESSSKITLRGNSTFTNDNQPLIVVDGVPIDNSTTRTVAADYPYSEGLQGVDYANRAIDLNPDDIESVTILKGPAAAALYGVRAGAGAVIYTTKRGAYDKSQGIRATYNFSADISQVNRLPELQMTWAQGTGGGVPDSTGGYSQGVYDVCDFGPDMIAFTADDVSYGTPNSWGPKISSLAAQGVTATDNLAAFFQTATTYTHNLSLMGGGDNSSFRLSVLRLDQEGIVPNTFYDKTSIRLTSDANITAKWKMGGTVNYIASKGRRAQNGSNLSGIMLGLTRAPASYNLNDKQYGYVFPTEQQRQYYYVYDNPYWSVYNNVFNDKVDRVLGSAYLTWTPFKWLTGTYRVGVDVISDNRKFHWAPGAWNADEIRGEVHENNQRHAEYYGDLLITANYNFTDKINASLTLGNNLDHRYDQNLFARGRIISVPKLYNLSNTTTLYADEAQTYVRTAALFFDLNASYDDLIFLNATGRNEWASTFGPNRSSFFYPSVSLSFVFSELIPENKILSFGKLRLAYAQSGISPQPYTSKTYYLAPFITDGFTNGVSFPYLGNNGMGINSTLGNPDLKPERVSGKEIGADLRFFLGRFNIDFTYYDQLTTDILVLRPIAASTGFRFMESNTGEMSNKGVELIVSGDPVKTSAFTWNISVNWARNKNKVLKLAEGVNEISLETGFTDIASYAIVGDAYSAFYGTKWVRDGHGNLVIDPSTGLPYSEPLEANIGNPFPDWFGGLRNEFTFKGLTLSALLDVRQGQSIWNGTIARLHRIGRTAESANRERMYVIPGVLSTGTDANGNPIPGTERNNVEISAYDYFTSYIGDVASAAKEQSIYDGSWIRLREVGLSYRFNLKGKVPIVKDLSLGFTGRNLWLKTNYPGVDPETSLLGAGSNLNGWDYFNMPGSKSYIFSISVDF